METAEPNRSPLKKNAGENPQQRLERCIIALSPWFAKWTDTFPMHPVTQLQIATYAEALFDLTLAQIERGCAEATKLIEVFPKPSHIREHSKPQLADFISSGRTWEEPTKCEACRDTGWRMVNRPDGQGQWATRCRCPSQASQ
jgi:hypothetical protein